MYIKRIISFIIIWLSLTSVIFIMLISIFGVPSYMYIRLFPAELVPYKRYRHFYVEVNPSTPLKIGQRITITVKDKKTMTPIQGASISVYKDSGYLGKVYTNSEGKAIIQYLGETTILVINKEGYMEEIIPIPHIPDRWVRDIYISGILSPILGAIIGVVINNIINTYLRKRKQ